MRGIQKAFIVVDSMAMILIVLPFAAHFKSWNTATCYMMLFSFLGCLLTLVNAIIWSENLSNPSPVFCDISTKIQIGLSMAMPLASLCINRRLALLRTSTPADALAMRRRREALMDTLICVLTTLIFMAVHYTMQGHRYDIFEDFGCKPTTYMTEPGFVLVVLPPVIVSLISSVYCAQSIVFFFKRHHDFEKYLRNSSNNMSKSAYVRLMALSAAELLFGLPFTLYFMIIHLVHAGLQHWISWDDTKLNFNRFDRYTRWQLEMSGDYFIMSFEVARWIFPFTCLLFFAFFGLSGEAYKSYYNAYAFVARKVFRKQVKTYDQHLYSTSTTAASPKPMTFSLFGRTIAIYSPTAWKKANETTINKSVSVALPQHASDLNVAGRNRRRRDSMGFSVISAEGEADQAVAELEEKRFSSCDSSSTKGSFYHDKELADVLADLPVLDSRPNSMPSAPAAAHVRHGSDQLTVHMEIERVQHHV